jgi:hypothetical protein
MDAFLGSLIVIVFGTFVIVFLFSTALLIWTLLDGVWYGLLTFRHYNLRRLFALMTGVAIVLGLLVTLLRHL